VVIKVISDAVQINFAGVTVIAAVARPQILLPFANELVLFGYKL
jgi:hypothetical protein